MNNKSKIEKILFLGPKGSYTDIVKNKFTKYFSTDPDFIAVDSIYNVFELLKDSNSHTLAAVLPLENSIEGIVRETQDNLSKILPFGFRILAETTLNIEHCLVGYVKNKLEIEEVLSHQQAISQCRNFISANLNKNIKLSPVLSTSQAVNSINYNDSTKVAIASEYCANLYEVPIIEKNINDENNNTTRFILLSKVNPIKGVENKISIKFSTLNKPGALKEVLTILESYNLNMSYIDSRPSRKELGEYVFYIDFSGFIEDSNVFLALTEIQNTTNSLEIISDGAEIIA